MGKYEILVIAENCFTCEYKSKAITIIALVIDVTTAHWICIMVLCITISAFTCIYSRSKTCSSIFVRSYVIIGFIMTFVIICLNL